MEGFACVSKIVMALYDKALDSDIIGGDFEQVDVTALVDHQTKFIAQVMGGPASYSDAAVRMVHARHKVDRPAFDEMAMLLLETLEDFGLEPADIDRIMDQVGGRAQRVVNA
jgi:hemoglobin